MKELKVGERIRIFAGYLTYDGVVKEASRDFITCQTDINATIVAHRKQCRRLKKKEKKKPREWWINIYPNGYASKGHKTKEDAIEGKTNPFGTIHEAETILVREVIERKK